MPAPFISWIESVRVRFRRQEAVRAPAAQHGPADLDGVPACLEKLLLENILPFWHPGSIDSEHGGYRLNHGVRGKWKGPSDKYLVTQARALWFFSRLLQTPYGRQEHIEAAAHGYRFLRDQLWDSEFGGFYWQVDSTGRKVVKPGKHLYGQAFGLYASAQYAMSAHNSEAASLARDLFGLLETLAHDAPYGGYLEAFHRDWTLQAPASATYLNCRADLKLMNTHLHLMEAITVYYRLTADPRARDRLIELTRIHSDALKDHAIPLYSDRHRRDWSPIETDRISYGHNLEMIWLQTSANRSMGISCGPLPDRYRALFAYCLRYGFDHEAGGFYASGRINRPADRRNKIWWVQAEALVAALEMYELTDERIYLECFLRMLDWIVASQADWKYGDWHAQLTPDGRPAGDKSGAWKAPYHNGRAMIECLERLAARSTASAS